MTQDSITSSDNKWIKAFRAGLNGTGPRDGQSIGIEGVKLVADALGSGLETEAVLVSYTGEQGLAQVLDAAAGSQTGIPRGRIFRTTDKLFASIAGTDTPQGIAALFRQPVWGLEDLLRGRANHDGSFPKGPPLIVVLAAVQDPGNVGAILRSAEAFGATGAIVARGTADPWSSKALRASAGSALRMPVLRGLAVPVILAQLRISQVQVVTATARASASRKQSLAAEECLRGPAAIFVGNEGAGLPAEIEHAADANITIAMSEVVESLNAAVAAAIVLYEAARSRNQQPRINAD